MPADLIKLRDSVPGYVYDMLRNSIMDDFTIDTNLKLAHFLAQCHYESSNFTRAEENLNYSAARLLQVFPAYFDSTTAPQYAGKPEKIANRVYASRFGNGDEQSGDGWKYRGRGFIQLTFKANYKTYGDFKKIDFVKTPDRVATEFPLDSAAHFFLKNDLFDKCIDDKYKTAETITKRVSGSNATAAARFTIFLEYYSKLTSSSLIADAGFSNEYFFMAKGRPYSKQMVNALRVNTSIVNFHENKNIAAICNCGVDYSHTENDSIGNAVHYVAHRDLWNITDQDGIRYNCPGGYAVKAEDLKSYCDQNTHQWEQKAKAEEITGQGLIFGAKKGSIQHVGILKDAFSIYHYSAQEGRVVESSPDGWQQEYEEIYLYQRSDTADETIA